MSRPPREISTETVEDIAFRIATGETLRAIYQATKLSPYMVKKIINHEGFSILVKVKRIEIAALRGR